MKITDRLPPELLLPATESARASMHGLVVSIVPSIEYFSIGRSIAGRELTCYKIGKGRGRVTFFGTHHALESITANILYAFLYILGTPLCGELARGLCISHLLSLYTYFVLPCVNPDGTELRLTGDTASPLRSRLLGINGGDFSSWQANERGVDLNHNYGAGFAEYKQIETERGISAGATLYSGEYPESEPESRAVANFVRVIDPMAVISLHSQGEEIFFSPIAAAPTARRLSTLTGYPLSTPTGTAAFGGLCDYTGGVLGIPSFTLEVGRGKNPLPESDLPTIISKIGHALLALPTLI